MANITERTLCSPANPLVSISYISNTAVQGRGVGFISASFKGDKRLVTTCRHNFEQATSPDLRLVFMTASMTASGPHLSRELKMIGQPIFDPRPNSDIAFVVVSDPSNSNTHPLKLQPSDLDISPERPVLLNAQNISYEDQHRLCDFAVTRQEPVKKLGDRFYIQRSDGGFTVLAEDKSKHETEQMSARKCFYLSMISRRGFPEALYGLKSLNFMAWTSVEAMEKKAMMM